MKVLTLSKIYMAVSILYRNNIGICVLKRKGEVVDAANIPKLMTKRAQYRFEYKEASLT